MYNILILVVDQTRARLYGTETVHAAPVEMKGFSTAVARSCAPASIGVELEARHHNHEQVASAIASELDQLLINAPTTCVYLIASARFLNVLRGKLTPGVEKRVGGVLDKELGEVVPAELSNYIKVINSVIA